MDINRPATLKEIADAIGKTKRTIERQAINGDWRFTNEESKGKHKKRLYALTDLPQAIRHAVMSKRVDTKFDGKAEDPEVMPPAVVKEEQAVVPTVSRALAFPASGLPPLSSAQLTIHRAISNIVDFVNGSGSSTAKASYS